MVEKGFSKQLQSFPDEVWMPVQGYEGLYEISSLGRIKSISRAVKTRWGSDKMVPNAIMSPSCFGRYKIATLQKNGVRKSVKVHRLVAIHFIPNPENKPHINHKNADKMDNSIDNLEWCTHKENMKHAKKMGLIKANQKSIDVIRHIAKNQLEDKHPQARSVIDVKTGSIYPTIRKAAKEFGIKETKLAHMLRGRDYNYTNLKFLNKN